MHNQPFSGHWPSQVFFIRRWCTCKLRYGSSKLWSTCRRIQARRKETQTRPCPFSATGYYGGQAPRPRTRPPLGWPAGQRRTREPTGIVIQRSPSPPTKGQPPPCTLACISASGGPMRAESIPKSSWTSSPSRCIALNRAVPPERRNVRPARDEHRTISICPSPLQWGRATEGRERAGAYTVLYCADRTRR